ncbi:MAG: tetratricopeptide repeat protein [Spirochaetota bacterium]|nr:tetratricopeptide repeat protein [Spirochaetota bacterium]
MFITYAIIFICIIFITIVGLYIFSSYIAPRKIEEIEKMIEAGQTKLAIKKLNDILEKDDRNAFAHYLLAEANMKEKNIQYAILEYRQVLKLAKFDHKIKENNIRQNLARIYLNRNAIEEAKKEYLILTKIDPANYESYFELGQIFLNSGVYDKAVGFFKKSISLNKDAITHYYLGQSYYRKGNYDEAKQFLLQSLKMDQGNYKAHYFLGLVLRQMGDNEWAIKEFDTADKDNDIKVKCFLAKGTCYLEMGQLPKAIMEFDRGLKYAKKGSSSELNIRYFMADAQEKMRDLNAAIINWEKISEVKKDFRDVQEKLKAYSEFRQDDHVKDFMIAGLSQFEHLCRKMVEKMGYSILDIETSETEVTILAVESEQKWRNLRKSNRIIYIVRSANTIGDRLLRQLHESMKQKNATRVIIISVGDYSQSAIDFANTRPIDLLGKNEIVNILKKL